MILEGYDHLERHSLETRHGDRRSVSAMHDDSPAGPWQSSAAAWDDDVEENEDDPHVDGHQVVLEYEDSHTTESLVGPYASRKSVRFDHALVQVAEIDMAEPDDVWLSNDEFFQSTRKLHCLVLDLQSTSRRRSTSEPTASTTTSTEMLGLEDLASPTMARQRQCRIKEVHERVFQEQRRQHRNNTRDPLRISLLSMEASKDGRSLARRRASWEPTSLSS